tara:strand:- start:667 stop:1731 length:1065 start_codon:yes stop_codon:yes gene_type:complete
MANRGYILFPRELMDEDFWKFTPVARQVFLYLMMRVNYVDGRKHKRGQMFTSYGQIKENLAWYVGFRKHTYSDSQIRNAMNHLMTNGMIITTKEPRGLSVTICDYERYQDPKSYERHNEQHYDQQDEQQDERQQDDKLYVNERKNNTKEKEKRVIDNSLPNNVITYSRQSENKVVVKESEERVSIQKQITKAYELAGGWLLFQAPAERYLIESAIKKIGFDLVCKVTAQYRDEVKSGKIKENPISSSRYWWSSGVYTYANRTKMPVANTSSYVPPEKKVKRKCDNCHEVQEFLESKIPNFCPLCNEGSLCTRIEYQAKYPPPPPKPKPQEPISEAQREGMEAIKKFTQSFGSNR